MGNTAIAADGASFNRARSDSLLHLLWPAVCDVYDREFQKSPPISSKDIHSKWVMPTLRRFTSKWVLPEATGLPGAMEAAEAAAPERAVEFYWVGANARIAGTLVHRWMQVIAEGLIHIDANTIATSRLSTMRWLQEMGIRGEAATAIATRVEQALAATLADARGQWILAGEGYSELALTGVIDGELSAVVLDRVRVDENGTHWIVDYKTSTHEGGNLKGFLQAETDRYTPQLARYATLYRQWKNVDVKCALYFPLLQSFVEVNVSPL
jgi:hypothetical protein